MAAAVDSHLNCVGGDIFVTAVEKKATDFFNSYQWS